MGMRLLVCGGRAYPDQARVFEVLTHIHIQHGVEAVIHGDAGRERREPAKRFRKILCGADKFGGQWARLHGVKEIPEPADWDRHGPRAGFIRNQLMLDKHRPTHVVAFPGGPGTADMVYRAKSAGLEVMEVEDVSSLA